MNFASDNVEGASPKVMGALVAANAGATPAYGADDLTRAVEERFAEIFERSCVVELVATGTAANALALASVTPPWGAVLCHDESHVADDECGAPEFFSHGAKLVALPGVGCKLDPADVAAALERMQPGVLKQAQPAALSITQATECGQVYACDEIAALAAAARPRGLVVHLDGARFANALAALGCSPAQMTWKAGVDVVSFGATKNGCLAAEAVIVFDGDTARELPWRKKRGGHTLSKNRLIAAQMLAYLERDHWLDNARHANAMAARLAAGFREAGLRLGWPAQANEVFPILPEATAARLKAAAVRFHAWSPRYLPHDVALGANETLARFVTSFRTVRSDVDRLIALARDG